MALALFATIIAAYILADALGWLLKTIMLQRHDVLSSGIKLDRDWWYTTKLICVIAPAAAYAVIATLL